MSEPCNHPCVYFADSGRIIVCDRCPAVWSAAVVTERHLITMQTESAALSGTVENGELRVVMSR